MTEKTAIVVTSIAKPNQVLSQLAAESIRRDNHFIVIGDQTSPADFELQGCDFYSIQRQLDTQLKFAQLCPVRHYARKNIGYLIAIQNGASIIVETDDDNMPYETFWDQRTRRQNAPTLANTGWVNVYSYFTEANIWPRGLPLDTIHAEQPSWHSLNAQEIDCPIQQGLANENPDVDAIYRLILPLPQSFRDDVRIALAHGAWCPFNSQNTTWWSDCFPLLYLPAYCSFRMTDIWRSFVAQAIAWVNEWSILFHKPTVWQERNEHDLIKDFSQEIPGYLKNREICEALSYLPLKPGTEHLTDNIRLCYQKLVDICVVKQEELILLEAWLEDLDSVK